MYFGAESHSLVSTEPNTAMESILDPTHQFSTLSILIGVTAKVLRAVQGFKNLKRREVVNTPVNPVKLNSFG